MIVYHGFPEKLRAIEALRKARRIAEAAGAAVERQAPARPMETEIAVQVSTPQAKADVPKEAMEVAEMPAHTCQGSCKAPLDSAVFNI